MITANGQALKGTSKEVAFIQKTINKIKKEKNFVIFQDSRLRAKNRKKILSAQGRRIGDASPPPRMIANIDHMNIEGMDPVSVAYTKKLVSVQKDGVVDIKKANILFHDFWSLNPAEDFELIFFLRHVSSSVKRREIVELDEKEETKKKLSTFVGDSEVKYHIAYTLSPDKHMNGNEVPLRTIAASWNVKNAEEGDINQVKLDLYDAVMESEKNKMVTKRGIKEFVEDVQAVQSGDYGMIKLRADMQKAVDKKIIVFDENRCVFAQDSPIEKEFFRVKPSDMKMAFEKLVYHAKNNKRDLQLILDEMEKSNSERENYIRQINEMEDQDELIAIGRDRNIDLRGAPGVPTIKKKIIADIEEDGI